MKNLLIFACLFFCGLFSGCSSSPKSGLEIRKTGDGHKLYIDGRETYIKGV